MIAVASTFSGRTPGDEGRHGRRCRRGQLIGMSAMPSAGLTARDLLGALGVFLLVFLRAPTR